MIHVSCACYCFFFCNHTCCTIFVLSDCPHRPPNLSFVSFFFYLVYFFTSPARLRILFEFLCFAQVPAPCSSHCDGGKKWARCFYRAPLRFFPCPLPSV
jgi:hypothetical protein